MRKPDFLIVGAPKCGTTALYDFLNQHPQIFMPELKEPHYFIRDVYDKAVTDTDEYFALFDAATDDQLAGEASTWYLYVKSSADEIRAVCGTIKIIIMLRNPVDMMYSLHGHNIFKGRETITDFGAAMAAETERKAQATAGAPATTFTDRVFYRDAATYSDKVQHYFDVFGRENVMVILYDDFRADNVAVYNEVLGFLGIDDFEPDIRAVNVNRKIANQSLNVTMKKPPSLVRRVARTVLPQSGRRAIGEFLRGVNVQSGKRDKLDPAVRQHYLNEFHDEIDRLGAVLGRDLSFWK